MPCSPQQNEINIGASPGPSLPGFGIPLSPPQLPLDFELPEGVPEDLIALLQEIFALIPGGKLTPNVDNFSKNVQDALASLLNQLGPYLALYNMLQALFNLILCIIDVICALLRPFKLARAVRKLFKRCLPDFLNILPFLAIIAMIIALLLLLIALIEYLIRTILDLIQQIIENIQILTEALSLDDDEAVLAAVNKIAYLLCLIEQVFAILIAFQAIFAIIEALMRLSGRSICGKGSGRQGDDSECCSEDVCPDFIALQPDGFVGETGKLIYHKALFNDLSSLGFSLNLPAFRGERWQFIDTNNSATFKFLDIITPINDNIFYPEGVEFNAETSLAKAPYILDMTLRDFDPSAFGHSDSGGARDFQIKGCVVTKKPYIGVLDENSGLDKSSGNTNGTLSIEAGFVYEDIGDGELVAYNVDGEHATLNTFIHIDPVNIDPDNVPNDGYEVSDIEYNLRINHEALVEYFLITLGCIPSVAIESETFNSTYDITPVIDRMGPLPNIGSLSNGAGAPGGVISDIGGTQQGTGALGCLETALAKFRSNITAQTAADFQAEVETCLNNLRDETVETYKNAVIAGTNQFTSTVTINPELQFVGEPIQVKVVLRDFGGNIISFNVLEEVREEIAEKLDAEVTFGKVSDFTFDGYNSFVADIDSVNAGSGEVTVTFEGNTLSLILNRDDDDITTQIVENVNSYEFVGELDTAVSDESAAIRRDESDVGN